MLLCDGAPVLQQMEVSVGLNHQEGTGSCCTATSEACQQLSIVVVWMMLDIRESVSQFAAMCSCHYTEDTPLHLKTILMKGETEGRSCQSHCNVWLLWGGKREQSIHSLGHRAAEKHPAGFAGEDHYQERSFTSSCTPLLSPAIPSHPIFPCTHTHKCGVGAVRSQLSS